MRTRVGIVGCGEIAQTHLEALLHLENVTPTVLCDVSPEKMKALQQKFNFGLEHFTELDSMLGQVDAVHICTPHYFHCDMAVRALEAGKHVILEKPVALSIEETRRIIEARDSSAGKICICLQNRYLARNIKAKELIESGMLGGIQSARAEVRWRRDAEYYTQSDWRGRYQTEGGGVMINQAIHTLDLLLWMYGMPEKVKATLSNRHLKGIIEVEDTCESSLTFPGGREGTFFATTANTANSPIFLELVCEKGTLVLSDDKLFLNERELETVDKAALVSGKSYWGQGHLMLFADFYSTLDKPGGSAIDIEEAAKSLQVVLAMYKSNGKAIQL